MDVIERFFESRQFHQPTYTLGDFNIDWLKKSPLKRNIEDLMNLHAGCNNLLLSLRECLAIEKNNY